MCTGRKAKVTHRCYVGSRLCPLVSLNIEKNMNKNIAKLVLERFARLSRQFYVITCGGEFPTHRTKEAKRNRNRACKYVHKQMPLHDNYIYIYVHVFLWF